MADLGQIQNQSANDGSTAPDVEELYRRHRDWLRDLARRRLRLQPADAEDVVQEVYVRLAQQGPAIIQKPRAFLSMIAVNLLRDGKRRSAVRDAHATGVRLSHETAKELRGLAEQETRYALEQIILALPEPQRDVFVLSRFQNMTNQDIAKHLGVSIKTVEWRMSRALDFCLSKLRD